MIIIHNGDWITCPNGHRQVQALRDIHTSDLIRSADFVTEEGLHPAPETKVAPCTHCGAVYIRTVGNSFRPHVEGRGWLEK